MRIIASTVAGLVTSSGAIRFRTHNETRFTVDEEGDVGIGIYKPAHLLHIVGGAYCDGGAWVAGSSREYKENITSLRREEAFEALEGLNPVRFNYKRNKKEEYIGFIAEDVPELVATRNRKGVSTMDVVAVLTKVVKEQQRVMQEQRKNVQEQQEMNKEQQRIIMELLEKIEALEKEK
ncbi:MAG: tail fiber domain-containing protein [Candidatus Aminicenantes bacterium]|nr:MAG: tail fiber domain-containing protein [Candidatus Aminicenantes bacterium]